MDNHQRGRSPSQGHTHPIRHTPSPHNPQGPHQAPSSGIDLAQPGAFDNTFGDQQPAFTGAPNDYNSNNRSYAQTPTFSQPGLFDQNLPEGLTSGASYDPQGNTLYGNFGQSALTGGFDTPLFSDASTNNDFLSGALDPAFISGQSNQQSISPASLMNTMTTQAHQTSPTPPHLLSPSMQRQSSGSPQNSPGLQQGAFQQPTRHSRNTSLDPSSAAYPPQMMHGGEWNGMRNFTQHRRAPSDAHSDVSSSAHPSPFLGNIDSFDQVDNHSPMLHAQQDPSMYSEVMGIGSFSIADGQNPYVTPGHSPQPSPRLVPQQHLPTYTSADNYGMGQLAPTMNSYNNANAGLEMFPGQGQEAFPALHPGDAMSPPEINIQLAPPSRQASFEPTRDEEAPQGALSPPENGRSRNRTRAKSDSSLGPRTHSSPGGHRESKDMLSPAMAGVGSRSPSPSGKSRRSSTSSVPNREYLLGLADPSRPASDAAGETGASKRTQKHPATFQCSLCPKRFTRAYNLRSHLRTHTDERPFVCSVCGKAFARQHDRKRHEGLHSGEKKFVCRGSLKEGGNWGCGRRFARADALGRHFRSEAGRVCIKPLLEEEARERIAKDTGDGVQSGMQMGMGMQQPITFDTYGNPIGGASWDPNMGGQPPMPYRLPTVLLQQYPTLGNIWDTLPNTSVDVEDDISGRSSFDASGEEYEEGEYAARGGQSGWASDVGY